jgi:hypothetical protein
MSNTFPPWAAYYRALTAGRLIALDKCPGVQPIGVGKTWRRLIAKVVLFSVHAKAEEACGVDQLVLKPESTGIEVEYMPLNSFGSQ